MVVSGPEESFLWQWIYCVYRTLKFAKNKPLTQKEKEEYKILMESKGFHFKEEK